MSRNSFVSPLCSNVERARLPDFLTQVIMKSRSLTFLFPVFLLTLAIPGDAISQTDGLTLWLTDPDPMALWRFYRVQVQE